MRLISLNVWGGQAGPEIIDFFKRKQDVDIFLLQEVLHHATAKTDWSGRCRTELFTEIQEKLPEHQGYFAPSESDEWGQAAFIRKSISIKEMGQAFVFRWKDALVERDAATLGRNIQYFKILHKDKNYCVINFHGLWNKKGKGDTDDRFEQSKNVKTFLDSLMEERILLCGDFNLLPATKSFKMLAEGMRDLIADHRIDSTRSSLYKKETKFADYILVSPAVRIKKFEVLQETVSDHLSLFLEFE